METREAHSVEGLPDCDGEVSTYTVGREYYRAVTMDGYNSPQRVKTSPVTKITVEADLPGHYDPALDYDSPPNMAKADALYGELRSWLEQQYLEAY